MSYDLSSVTGRFVTERKFLRGGPYGTGHIHDTFAVTCGDGAQPRRYLLQRINHKIFTDPARLIENIERVTRHVRSKLQAGGVSDVERRVLTLIPARDGGFLVREEDGNFWRMYRFIEGAATHDTLKDLEHAYEAARAFGEFQESLRDLPGPPLHETIRDFHNGLKRFAAFQSALTADAHNRAKKARSEIRFLTRQADLFDVLPGWVERGEIPIRITHNDTKVNNVMLDDATGKGICVIDLDTVMAGLSAYDFGDLVRSSGCGAPEDERDLSKVALDVARFEALLRGYLSATNGFLTGAERKNLVLGSQMMTLLIGTRFLTDFLQGDPYFKVHRENHNLDRCRVQFRLVQSIHGQREILERLVERVSGEPGPCK